jgi:hypothetical protein
MEKKRELVRMDEVNELIDGICGVVLTRLSSLAARCAPRGARRVRGAHRDGQSLPADGRQVR